MIIANTYSQKLLSNEAAEASAFWSHQAGEFIKE